MKPRVVLALLLSCELSRGQSPSTASSHGMAPGAGDASRQGTGIGQTSPELARLISDLDSENFSERRAADRELRARLLTAYATTRSALLEPRTRSLEATRRISTLLELGRIHWPRVLRAPQDRPGDFSAIRPSLGVARQLNVSLGKEIPQLNRLMKEFRILRQVVEGLAPRHQTVTAAELAAERARLGGLRAQLYRRYIEVVRNARMSVVNAEPKVTELGTFDAIVKLPDGRIFSVNLAPPGSVTVQQRQLRNGHFEPARISIPHLELLDRFQLANLGAEPEEVRGSFSTLAPLVSPFLDPRSEIETIETHFPANLSGELASHFSQQFPVARPQILEAYRNRPEAQRE